MYQHSPIIHNRFCKIHNSSRTRKQRLLDAFDFSSSAPRAWPESCLKSPSIPCKKPKHSTRISTFGATCLICFMLTVNHNSRCSNKRARYDYSSQARRTRRLLMPKIVKDSCSGFLVQCSLRMVCSNAKRFTCVYCNTSKLHILPGSQFQS